MNGLNGKKIVLMLLAAVLCVTMCAPAFASVGDRILVRYSDATGYIEENIQTVVQAGDGICVVISNREGRQFLLFKDPKGDPETFVMPRDTRDSEPEPESEGEEEEGSPNTVTYENVSDVFSWNGEMYALVDRTVTGDGFWKVDGVSVKRIKLENGQAVLEDSGLPDLDITELVNGDEEYQYYDGMYRMFMAGDLLVGMAYSEDGTKVCKINLREGTTDVMNLGDNIDNVIAGPEGSILVTRIEWEGEKARAVMSRVSLEDGSEETLWEKADENLYSLNPCYDPESDSLFFAYKGELWKMPLSQPDIDQAEAVNDCPDAAAGSLLLPDGFVVMWTYNVVIMKNTDPAQRGSITLRIRDFNYTSALNETIYDMNDTRGDVSVVLNQEYELESGTLQAMMNRDAYTDVYAMDYKNSDCSALRNRGYMMDLSGNEQIAEYVSRMYPYIRDAVTIDGKIIGVPMEINGATFGVNLEVLERLGLKEEDLPKTWEQFFDWVEAMPAVLEGQQEASLAGSWEDRLYVRAQILNTLLTQYQVWMDSKGDNYLFNTPLLNSLITRLNNLDYEGLGVAEHQEGDDDDSYYSDDEDEYREAVLELWYQSTPGGYNSRYKPLLLSFAEGEDPVMPVDMAIAFVNPYSEHPQEAMEFLALSMKNLYSSYRYAIFTDQTEPIRYPYYAENIKILTETLEEFKKQLQEESDEDNKPALEEIIKEYEGYIKDEENYSWEISPQEIERYQQNQGLYKVQDYSFIYDMMKNTKEKDNEEEENYYNEYEKLVYGEENFGLGADELLNTIDQKIQMIRLEGN